MNATSTRRQIAVIGLVAGPLAFAAGDLIRRIVITSNGSSTATQIAEVHEHSGLWLLASLLTVVGSMAWAISVPAVVRIVTGRGSTLSTVGGYLLGIGLLASIGHAVSFYGMLAMYDESGADKSLLAAVDDASGSSALFVLLIILFILGLVLGQILLAIGLRRARMVPVWVPVAAIVFAVAGSTNGVPAGVVGVVAALLAFVPIAFAVVSSAQENPIGSESLQRS